MDSIILGVLVVISSIINFFNDIRISRLESKIKELEIDSIGKN